MKNITIFLILLTMLFSEIGYSQIALPPDHFVEGWMKSGPERHFAKNDLYGYINGGAELFHEYGFETLLVQIYSSDGKELGLDLYRMESSEAALGIYLMKCGVESPDSLISERNSSGPYQITAVKGRYFIIVNNFSGDGSGYFALRSLMKEMINRLPGATETEVLRFLPESNKIPGSELIVRGPFALQAVYTFGDGDVLQLGGKVYGVLADYKTSETGHFTLLLIDYPDSIAAASAYVHLLDNLDKYIKVLEYENRYFSFVDYKKKFGIVKQMDARLEIRIQLDERPHFRVSHDKKKARTGTN